MYRGFKLSLDFNNIEYYSIGENIYESQKTVIQSKLRDFIYEENSLDGSKMQNEWFPQIDAHVFISHSHKDLKSAITLGGWLWQKFKLKSFIDSLVWGYSTDLLKSIDNEFCLNPGGQTYDYHSRNFSTSHVHMMLCTALAMMIDRTECLFFLNTPNSICPKEGIEKTLSPWIYFEIATTKLVEQKIPVRDLLEGTRVFSEKQKFEKSWQMAHEVDLSHLTTLEVTTLESWGKGRYSMATDALDALYGLKPAKKNKTTLEG